MPLSVPVLTVSDPALSTPTVQYTLSNSDPSATNVLYRWKWNGTAASLVQTTADTITGNIANKQVTTTAGYHWWVVQSTLGAQSAMSNLFYMPIADVNALAVETRCRNAIVNQLLALNLSGIGSNVFAIPAAEELTHTMPCCVVFPEPTSPAEEVGGPNDRDDILYSFQVCFMTADTFGMSSPQDTYRLWEQTAARLFRYVRLPGVPECIICTVDGPRTTDPVPDFYNQVRSAFTVKVTCREGRGA